MTYVLPDLDYDYGALAPHITPEIMELHHSKVVRGYDQQGRFAAFSEPKRF